MIVKREREEVSQFISILADGKHASQVSPNLTDEIVHLDGQTGCSKVSLFILTGRDRVASSRTAQNDTSHISTTRTQSTNIRNNTSIEARLTKSSSTRRKPKSYTTQSQEAQPTL